MSPPQTSTPIASNVRDRADTNPGSRHVPHAVFGIGAIVLVLLSGLVLMLISGHVVRSRGPLIVVAIGVPILVALAVVIAQRWRRAQAAGHS
jgi:hypothetical protein